MDKVQKYIFVSKRFHLKVTNVSINFQHNFLTIFYFFCWVKQRNDCKIFCPTIWIFSRIAAVLRIFSLPSSISSFTSISWNSSWYAVVSLFQCFYWNQKRKLMNIVWNYLVGESVSIIISSEVLSKFLLRWFFS